MELEYDILAEQYSSKSDDYYECQRPEMLRFIPDKITSLLDVGCSQGSFGELVKANRPGCEVWGIEPGAAAAAAAGERLDNVVCGTLQSAVPQLEGKRFDCVVFNDVLEHLVNPEKALLDCRALLKDGGSVVASIPNILFFYQMAYLVLKQDWKYQESGVLDYTHLRFFTKKSIVRMFESCGFRVVTIEGINAPPGMAKRLFSFLTLGLLKDWKYLQFAVRAELRDVPGS